MSEPDRPLAPTKPSTQRPEHPDFWCKRFAEGCTPWDAGRVPNAFAAYVQAQPDAVNCLIPGCGSAWEAAHLAAIGWPVTALDFSPAAVASARQVLGAAAVDLVCADFFTFTPRQPYSLIYERAFLCALPPAMRAAWGQRVADLLPAGGKLAGFFFLCEQRKGPPFGIQPDELAALLGPNFAQLEDAPVAESIPAFAGHERWQVWQRREDA